MRPNVGEEEVLSVPPRISNWKVALTLGLIHLYYFWRDARLRKESSNAPYDAKSKASTGRARKRSSPRT
jgi:hypothetical protein